MQSESRITQQELASLFPDGVPMPLMKMIFPEKSEKLTVEDIRYILNAMRSEAALSTDAEPVGYTDQSELNNEQGHGLFAHASSDRKWLGDNPIALYAEPVKTAPAVAVKTLEWVGGPNAFSAATIVGTYYVDRSHGKARFYALDRSSYKWSNSVEEAKAAAQADYEARIRSAISAQVQDVAGWQNEEKLTPEQAWTILCETPDITSPEEYPDHALITFEQLQSYMERAHNSVEWKDISTAPRDGTKILMRGGAYHGLPFAGYWDRSPYAPDRPWVSAVNNSRLYEHVPTQWMPLPASPASKHGDADHG